MSFEPENMPPGTVLLLRGNELGTPHEIIPVPTPSADPNDPLNWTAWRKALAYTYALAVTVAVFTALSTQTVLWQQMSIDMNVSFAVLNNALSPNSAGCTLGCVFFIPFAKKYGRRPVYIVTTLVMAAVSWWSSRMQTVPELYITNLLYGLAGATNETIVQMTIADLFFIHQRGRMNGLYLAAVMTGSFLTSIPAGAQAVSQGWRASYYSLAIALTILGVFAIFGCEETKYVPIFQGVVNDDGPGPESQAGAVQDVTLHLQSKSDDDNYVRPLNRTESKGDATTAATTSDVPLNSYRQRMRWTTPTSESLWKVLYLPLYVTVLPHVIFTSLQYASGVTWLVILASIVSIVFSAPPYSFSTMGIGLMAMGPFVGNIFGSIYAGWLGDWAIARFARRNRGIYEPEFRLYILLPPALFLSGGLIMFGVTADRGMHWIYPSIGGAFFAFGLGAIGDVSFTLVLDSYQPLTGEAFVGVAFWRNALSIGIPFGITPWLETNGLTNMFVTCGCISLFISMLFIPLIFYGKRIRTRWAPYYEKLLLEVSPSRG